MCLAVPMKVVELDDQGHALVEQEGVTRKIRVDFVQNLEPGEYVLVHAGMAIERVRPEEAELTLQLLKELTDEIHR